MYFNVFLISNRECYDSDGEMVFREKEGLEVSPGLNSPTLLFPTSGIISSSSLPLSLSFPIQRMGWPYLSVDTCKDDWEGGYKPQCAESDAQPRLSSATQSFYE